MNDLKKDILTIIFFTIGWLLIGILHEQEILLFVLLELLGIGLLLMHNNKEVVFYYLTASSLIAIEFYNVLMGAWTYTPSILPVPLWISPLAAITMVMVRFTNLHKLIIKK